MHIAASKPEAIDKKSLKPSIIKREEDVQRESIISSGKPEKIIEKILEGKMNKFYSEVTLLNQSFIIESKGAFNSQDRKKHKLIKEQHPELDIRFIFSNSKTKIGKKSKTTYGKWCDLFNFKYHCIASTKTPFPQDWLTEVKGKQNARRN